jgi:hypothetical protein
VFSEKAKTAEDISFVSPIVEVQAGLWFMATKRTAEKIPPIFPK